jgi:hypothetical protein
MQLTYKVQNPTRTKVSKTVELEGDQVQADVDCFECELVSTDGNSGTLKLRVVSRTGAAAAADLFTTDRIVTGTFAPA